jgi:DNA-directed RNA polymerase sigma subunit (sigma70/sigma32)
MNAPTSDTILKKYTANKDAIKVLDRYKDIFEYRNGLSDGVVHTQKETGQKFNIGATRVGQIEARVKYEIEKMNEN